ncbi:MAG TPA: DUF2993 domain-containing protein [Mycobacteriales bacterium]|nr:DUF2993 domain-containing protein [Mycobacteriales bacterium]
MLLAALAVVIDRAGEAVAAHVLAGKLQTDEHLPSRPAVSIRGLPFVTQAAHGFYKDVSVVADNFVTVDGVQLNSLKVHLRGVHIPLSRVVRGSVSQVPVDQVDGTAFISFDQLASYFASRQISVTFARTATGGLTVFDQLHAGSLVVSAAGSAVVSVANNVIQINVARLTPFDKGSKVSNSAVLPHVARLNLTVPLGVLPFRIQIHTVSVTLAGISGTGSASNVVLGGK